MREFSTGATRDTAEGKNQYPGFLSPLTLEAFGNFMRKNQKQADGKMRASDNWKKGIPRDAYLESMFRHFLEVWAIHDDYKLEREQDPLGAPQDIPEDLLEALCALYFNVGGYLHELCIGRDAGVDIAGEIGKRIDKIVIGKETSFSTPPQTGILPLTPPKKFWKWQHFHQSSKEWRDCDAGKLCVFGQVEAGKLADQPGGHKARFRVVSATTPSVVKEVA